MKHTKEISPNQVEGEAQVIARCVIAFDNTACNNNSKSTKEQVSLRQVMFLSCNTYASTGHFVISFAVPGQILFIEKQAKCSEVNG